MMVNFSFLLLQVKTIFLPTEKSMTLETCAPLIATLPLEVVGLTKYEVFLSEVG